MAVLDQETRTSLFEYLLQVGDDRLVLGHRLSEWCGHAPTLEEDIAIANIALDCLGQASWFFNIATELESAKRTVDDLVFLRDEQNFKNTALAEYPNGDFAQTLIRQFFFDTFYCELYASLSKSSHSSLSGLAEKGLKEVTYHRRHTSELINRLGNSTEEARKRLQTAVDMLWPLTVDLFVDFPGNSMLEKQNLTVPFSSIYSSWTEHVTQQLQRANLQVPEAPQVSKFNGRSGMHSEHLGKLLAEMQSLARMHPNVHW